MLGLLAFIEQLYQLIDEHNYIFFIVSAYLI
jgi:hypothetical protein